MAKVGDDALEGAAGDGLGLDGLEVLVVLADVGAEGDDVEALLAEPGEDDGGVEAAGVGQYDFVDFLLHSIRLSAVSAAGFFKPAHYGFLCMQPILGLIEYH